MLGAVGTLPDVYSVVEVKFYLLRRLLGVKTDGDTKKAKVQKLEKGELLNLNIGSRSTGGRVTSAKKGVAKLELYTPVCTKIVCFWSAATIVALSREGCVTFFV